METSESKEVSRPFEGNHIEEVGVSRLMRQIRVKYVDSSDWFWMNYDHYFHSQYHHNQKRQNQPNILEPQVESPDNSSSAERGVLSESLPLSPEVQELGVDLTAGISDYVSDTDSTATGSGGGKVSMPDIVDSLPTCGNETDGSGRFSSCSTTCNSISDPSSDQIQLDTSMELSSDMAQPTGSKVQLSEKASSGKSAKIDRVLGSMQVNRKRFYLIKWQGLDDTHITWEQSTGVSTNRLRSAANEARAADFNREYGRASSKKPKVLSPAGEIWAAEKRGQSQSGL